MVFEMYSRPIKITFSRRAFNILLTLFCLVATSESIDSCIKYCTCENSGDLLVADCTIGNFTDVPQPEPERNINILYLQFNRITRIRAGDFSLYNNLIELHLQGNRIDTLEENAFDGLQRLEIFDLSKNKITSIPSSETGKLTENLKWFALSMNAFRQVPVGLSNFTKLVYFDFSNNKFITKIPSDSFPETLELLDLHYTGIKYFQKSLFRGLTNLETLFLSDNMASAYVKFEDGVFDDLISLEYLDLSRCFCKRLPSHSFSQLGKLNTLLMNNCWLSKPPQFARYGSWESDEADTVSGTNSSTEITIGPSQGIWYNPELSFVDLSNNRRMTIKAKSVRFPPLLTDLQLEYTKITAIDNDLFNETSSIQKLNLCRSRLSTIARDAFMKFKNVSEICLSGNPLLGAPRLPATLLTLNLSVTKIKNLTHVVLKDLDKVVAADIKSNEIEWIEDYTFANMTSMKVLDLSENKIDTLRRNTLYIGSGPIATMSKSTLETLYLGSNLLRNIENEAFASHLRLQTLDLQHNFLDVLVPGMFANLQGLITLILSNNRIVDVTPHAFADLSNLEVLSLEENEIEVMYAETFKGTNSLKRLLLHKNKLVLFHEITFTSLEYLDISKNNLTTFPKFAGDSLTEIVSSYNYMEEVPTDAFEKVRNLERLDLGHCKMEFLNYSVFENTKNLKKLSLDDNFLTEFLNVKLPNLVTLIINENEIVNIDLNLKDIIPNIEYLDSRYNRITFLDPEIFSGLKSLSKLLLSGNNFNCDCDLLPLVQWMEKHLDVVVDADTYLCETPVEEYAIPIIVAVSELNCDVPQPQTHKAKMYIIIAVVTAVFTLIILFLTIVICRRTRIRRRRNQSAEQTQNEQDQVRLVSSEGCCYPCKRWCSGVSDFTHDRGQRGEITSEEQQDLMVSSPVSSPEDKEAPMSL